MNSKEKREAARSWAIENHLVSRGNPIILIVCGENVRALYYLLIIQNTASVIRTKATFTRERMIF